jgi:hypothetical protein
MTIANNWSQFVRLCSGLTALCGLVETEATPRCQHTTPSEVRCEVEIVGQGSQRWAINGSTTYGSNRSSGEGWTQITVNGAPCGEMGRLTGFRDPMVVRAFCTSDLHPGRNTVVVSGGRSGAVSGGASASASMTRVRP